ncbi:hypothetical protein HELRODRAFT_108097 [Helobdella robusta]|uniref:BBSome complex member BBS5 PH domain-containing protein n=1 Tax=Helobdella robusta TaxID=6412 RepID=T1EEF4_HELRO|nr:hypothetical protein HELRODRAFT_108097 [Helobdella robusta]ESN92694.1 hypothetical protein HELRODRAFT_108097 [Helobdella robusta]
MSGDNLWQDRETRFDVNPSLLNLVRGEKVILELNAVEDSKGNTGVLGSAILSNLRFIWHSQKFPKVNISLGHNCILSVNCIHSQSKIKSSSDSVIISAECSGEKYEFVFSNLIVDGPSLYTSLNSVLRAYVSSKMYREVKLRGSLFKDDALKTYPHEEIFREIHGVLNLSNDQGNIGVMIVTNVRVVWYALSNQIYNVSIPYLQIIDVKVKDSKFGRAIVFEITKQGGGYILGFRIDPVEKLQAVFREVRKLYKMFTHNPNYGIECSVENSMAESKQNSSKFSDDAEVYEDHGEHSDVFALYCVDGGRATNREPVYNEELGLLIEKLPDGYTLSDLWDVMK